ncbi:hypothetical protein C0J52_01402 [Blattella germanica]|nr:hypothetical protein C0J52_01402 [Blattella germanica]
MFIFKYADKNILLLMYMIYFSDVGVFFLIRYLDFINVMAYDMHGYWESKTGENSPMYVGSSDTSDYEKTQNVDYIIKYYIKKGAAPGKLLLGMGTYGNSFTLKSSSNNGVGAPIKGPGKAGPYSGEEGELAYNEICEQHNAGKWQYHWNSEQQCIYAVNGDQWVGFDDIKAIKIKTEYIKSKGLGGAMIWSIDMDDFRNKCGDGKQSHKIIYEHELLVNIFSNHSRLPATGSKFMRF